MKANLSPPTYTGIDFDPVSLAHAAYYGNNA